MAKNRKVQKMVDDMVIVGIPGVVSFVIPGLPPSSNHALGTAPSGHRFANAELKAWRQLVGIVPRQEIDDLGDWYTMQVHFYFPLYYKNGNIRRKDLSNMIKYTEDEIIKRLITDNPIDDRQIVSISAFKIDSEEERTEVLIATYEGND